MILNYIYIYIDIYDPVCTNMYVIYIYIIIYMHIYIYIICNVHTRVLVLPKKIHKCVSTNFPRILLFCFVFQFAYPMYWRWSQSIAGIPISQP